jgi:hypothetical protein
MSTIADRNLFRAILAIAVVLVSHDVAWAQTQVRVVKDQTIIWTVGTPIPITTVKANTVLDVTARQGDFYIVRVPDVDGRSGQAGMIAVSQVEVVGGPAPILRAAPSKEPSRIPEAVGEQRRTAPASAIQRRHVSFFGFGQAAYGSWLAHNTFSAVLDSPRSPMFGAGGQVRIGENFAIEGGVERFEKTGQRVFVFDSEVFKLGIRDTVRIVPVAVTATYRYSGAHFAPYAGGGVGEFFYKETSDFAAATENISQRFASYHAVAGVEFGSRTSVLKTAIEVQFTSVPHALGASGTSQAFKENNLGSLQFRIKVLAGR